MNQKETGCSIGRALTTKPTATLHCLTCSHLLSPAGSLASSQQPWDLRSTMPVELQCSAASEPCMPCSHRLSARASHIASHHALPSKSWKLHARLHLALAFMLLLGVAMFFIGFGFWFPDSGSHFASGFVRGGEGQGGGDGLRRYLYWGLRVDCPGKRCVRCGGLGHQESSLRCALEEAMFLNRWWCSPHGVCMSILEVLAFHDRNVCSSLS